MSLVGTRPPTVDEWDKYELHHRARLATKPGLTGMWQVSGRSNITDFEEVVKLDKQYISEWTMGLDKKNIIIFIGIVLVAVLSILGRKVISFEDKKHQTLVRQEMKEREKLEKEYMFDVGKSNEWNLDNSSFEVVENTDNLIRNVEKTSGYQGKESVTFHTSKNISDQKHIYMIAFVAWVEKESTKLIVRNGEKIESYSIVSQPTALCNTLKV